MTSKEKILILFLVFLVLPLLVLCWYIQPSADDFIYSSWHSATQRSFWAYHLENYLTWNGRYFSTLILSVNPLVFRSFIGYKILPLLLIIIFYFGLNFLIRNMFESFSKGKTHIISLFILITYLNLVPSLPETIYWMSGSVTYFLTWGMTLFFISFLIKYYKTPNNKLAFILFLLMFCIIGSNELSAFLVFFVVGIKLFFEAIEKKKISSTTIFFLIFCLIFVFVVVLSPGNTVRQWSYENHHNLRFSLINSFINLTRITVLIFKSPPFIILLLLLILNASELTASSEIFKRVKKIHLFIIAIFSILIAYFFYFVSSYSMGINPPLRVHAFVAFFIIISVLIIVLASTLFYFTLPINKEHLRKINVLVVPIFFIFIVSDFHKLPGDNIYIKGNICLASYDITHQAPYFNTAMYGRYKQIEKEKRLGHRSLTVPALHNVPRSIFFVDIKPDSTHWINWGYTQFFDINSIKTVE